MTTKVTAAGCIGIEALTSLMHITPRLHELRTFSSAARADSTQMVDSLCVCVWHKSELLHLKSCTKISTPNSDNSPYLRTFPFISPMKN